MNLKPAKEKSMKELKKEIEFIGGNLLETSDGVFIRAYNKDEIKQIQELLKKYPKYSLGYFAECNLYNWYYYETILMEEL